MHRTKASPVQGEVPRRGGGVVTIPQSASLTAPFTQGSLPAVDIVTSLFPAKLVTLLTSSCLYGHF